MKIRNKKKNHVDIANSGALSDLAFLLIIFFIVVAVFNINKGFMLMLPKKNSRKIVNIEDVIKVQLEKDEGLFLDGKEIDLLDLESIVEENLSLYPNMTFLLNIHPDVPYQRVVGIVEIVRKLKVENFSFTMMEQNL